MRSRSRAGVTLPEVLVAAMLLGVGVAGCVASLAVSIRFRNAATAREQVAATIASRLSWFEAVGCATPDTTIDPPPVARTKERWEVRHDPQGVRLTGAARSAAPNLPYELSIETRLACH